MDVLPSQAQDPIVDRAGFSGARLSRIDTLFEVDVRRGLIPGAVLLIERHGETVMRRAWGYRNRAVGAAMTLDTIFRIYSMTKPMVSVVTMMLAAEGKLRLDQPVSDFIPCFADIKVWSDGGRIAPERPPTIYDLLRHTSGLSYEANGGVIGPLYRDAQVLASDITNEEFVERLVTVPLMWQPGRVWEYGHSTDVLGRVVEVVAGRGLGAVLRQRLTLPLGMEDTGFTITNEADHARVAEALPGDTLSSEGKPLFDPRQPRAFEAGGMGLVSTLDDYAGFCRMLLGGGSSERSVFLSRPLLDFMTADHITPETGIAKGSSFVPGPGFGFGLGFAVRTGLGVAAFPGTPGEFNWSGVGGTYFWIDPERDLFAILLTQSPRQRFRYRTLLKTMVYDALVGGAGLKTEKKRRKAAIDDAPGLRMRT